MKKTFHMGFFCNFMYPLILERKTFTTWNVLKSEVYLARINFRKFLDHLKECLEVIRLQVDLKMWNLVSKCNFLCFPEKSIFELMANLKFSFSESGPGSVHILPNQYFYWSFQTFKGTLKMLQMTFCPQIQQEKSLKWP